MVDVDGEGAFVVTVDRALVVEVVAAFLTDVAAGEQEVSKMASPAKTMITRRLILTIPSMS